MIDPTEERQQIAGEDLRVLRDLVHRMPEDGLLMLRQMLREPNRWAPGTPAQRFEAADLLDTVCRRLVAAGVAPEGYFSAIAEMFPTVPDDVSGLIPEGGM